MKYIAWNIILILMIFEKCSNASKIRTTAMVRIINYHNPHGMKFDDFRCETFHFFDDKCDPKAEIAVYESGDLIKEYRSEMYKNRNYLENVGKFSIEVDLPANLRFVAKFWDVDSHRDELIFTIERNVTVDYQKTKMLKFVMKNAQVTLKITLAHVLPKPTSKSVKSRIPKFMLAGKQKGMLRRTFAMKYTETKSFLTTPWIVGGIVVMFVLISFLVVVIVVMFRRYQRVSRKQANMIQYIKRNEEVEFSANNTPQKTIGDEYDDCSEYSNDNEYEVS